MNPKNGTAGNLVEPIAPKEVIEAANAEPGKDSQSAARQASTTAKPLDSTTIAAYKPPTDEEAAQATSEGTELSWIEIELVGEDGEPIAGERYKVTLPDGRADEGTLDHRGWARVQGFAKGDCKVSFPELDKDAWTFVESLGARADAAGSGGA